MNKIFIITLREHRIFGWIFAPYFIEYKQGAAFYSITESVVLNNVISSPQSYTDAQKQIVKIIDEFSEASLKKFFAGRKKIGIQEYFLSLTPDYIRDYIRPYIEKRALKIIDICRQNGLQLFVKADNYNNIYPEDEIIISSGTAKAVYNFVRTSEETRYFLSLKYKNNEISLLKKSIYVISNQPCAIVLGNRLFTFTDIDAKKLLPFTEKEYVSVLKRVENQYYQKFVRNAVASDCLVKTSGFKIITEDSLPVSVLVLETDWTGEPAFTLYFDYNGVRFLTDSPTKNVVKFSDQNDDYVFSKLSRDFDFESDAVAAADEIFSGHSDKGVYKLKFPDADKNLQRAFTISFVNSHREQFARAGLIVEQNFIEKNYFTGKIDLDLRIDQKNDWFDVYAVVRLDDLEIPFISLKYYILNNIHEFELPDGRIVVLPSEWFEKYHDLFALGNAKKDDTVIKLLKCQFATVLELQKDDSDKFSLQHLNDILSNPQNADAHTPQNVSAVLRPYQIVTFNWLEIMRNNNFGACLADDMGLGKTLCTLSILADSPVKELQTFEDGLFSFPQKKPSLLVVPKSLIYNWKNEASKFTPQLKVLEYTGFDRSQAVKSFPLYDIVITGYGTLRNDAEVLGNFVFNYIVLDESQTVKNSQSKTYDAIMQLKGLHKLALTGTPIENSLTDLWSQMNFLNPGLLGSFALFKKKYVNTIEKNNNEEAALKLKNYIRPFLMRRTKQQVLEDLPELIEQTVFCAMSDAQKQVYESEKSRTRNSILDIMDKGTFNKSAVTVLQGLTKLRQIACNPLMIDDSYSDLSGKTDEIIRKLQSIVEQGNKVLVFSSFVKHLDIIARQLNILDIDFALLTGSTKQREHEVKRFTENSDVPVFLISVKAGGTGLNLTSADYVFIIDPWWNPQVESQAIARAHRMGRKDNVMVYRFISEQTVEEKIVKLQKRKADLAGEFINQTDLFSALDEKDVLEILE